MNYLIGMNIPSSFTSHRASCELLGLRFQKIPLLASSLTRTKLNLKKSRNQVARVIGIMSPERGCHFAHAKSVSVNPANLHSTGEMKIG